MSKTFLKNNAAIQALVKDAYGNGISGNTERSLRFIREALKLLDVQEQVIESKGDARTQMTFDKLNRAAAEQAGWPAFDGSTVSADIAKWAAKGITPDALDTVPVDEIMAAND